MLCPGPYYSQGGDGSRPTVPVMQIGSCWGRKAPLSCEGGGCTKMVAPDVCVQGLAQGVRGFVLEGQELLWCIIQKRFVYQCLGTLDFPIHLAFGPLSSNHTFLREGMPR